MGPIDDALSLVAGQAKYPAANKTAYKHFKTLHACPLSEHPEVVQVPQDGEPPARCKLRRCHTQTRRLTGWFKLLFLLIRARLLTCAHDAAMNNTSDIQGLTSTGSKCNGAGGNLNVHARMNLGLAIPTSAIVQATAAVGPATKMP